MGLPSSMADFVPCDSLLQKAYYIWNLVLDLSSGAIRR